jgi:hypothetical protein
MPKLRTLRRRASRRPHRRGKSTRRGRRSQHGGDLSANLAEKAHIVRGFLDTHDDIHIGIHPNFPRKNAQGEYALVFKDVELEVDSQPQPLLVMKMKKQGGEFVDLTVEAIDPPAGEMQEAELTRATPQKYIDDYPTEIGGVNADSAALSAALSAAFPEDSLAY